MNSQPVILFLLATLAVVSVGLCQDTPSAENTTPAAPAAPAVAAQNNVNQRVGPNITPNPGLDEKDADGQLKGWKFHHWNGSSELKTPFLVKEGPQGEMCFKLASEAPTDACFRVGPIAVKAHTTYRMSVSIKTENVQPQGKALGAVAIIRPLDVYSKAFKGTQDWKRVRATFNTGETKEIFISVSLGGDGQSSGTAWFANVGLREIFEPTDAGAAINTLAEVPTPQPPPPPPYKRPLLEDPVFNREALSLDIDQTSLLAETLVGLAGNYPEHPVLSQNDIRTKLLGLTLRLDPRNRSAIVMNGQLDSGQSPRPVEGNHDLRATWQQLDAIVVWMHGKQATRDDRNFARYLGDLTRLLFPDDGFGPEFVKIHSGTSEVDWSMILPPDPPPAGTEPPTGDVPNNTAGTDSTQTPPAETIKMPDTVSSGETGGSNEPITVPAKMPITNAEILTAVQTGGPQSRAALRKVVMNWDEWEYTLFQNADSEWERRKVMPKNMGPTQLKFANMQWSQMHEVWQSTTRPLLHSRYNGWPQTGVVEVKIPFYNSNSGSSAILAVATGFEAMARGLKLVPKVAVVGTFYRDHNASKIYTVAHSQIAGIVLGYGKSWSDVLIVGAGTEDKLKEVASMGFASPFLDTQIIEVSNMDEAIALATGTPLSGMKEAMETFKAIQAVRAKMFEPDMLQNRFVIDKIRAVAEASPKHLSAKMLLLAAQHQEKLDIRESINAISRLYQSVEQLMLRDIEWVSSEEGLETLAIFETRLRELKPRLDRRTDRFNIKIDSVLRSGTELLRLRDRSNATAQRRIESVQSQVSECRAAFDVTASAGK